MVSGGMKRSVGLEPFRHDLVLSFHDEAVEVTRYENLY
jgi:hypothetical protein